MMDDACIKKLPRKAKLDHKYYDFFKISLYLCLVQKFCNFFFCTKCFDADLQNANFFVQVPYLSENVVYY